MYQYLGLGELLILLVITASPAMAPALLSGSNAKKKPWLAACLNLIGRPVGLFAGYSYLHLWKRFVALLVVWVGPSPLAAVSRAGSRWARALLWALGVWDGHKKAKERAPEC